ncbi:MAG: NUDIX domain-containing protein [Acidimicrobiia bacterium]
MSPSTSHRGPTPALVAVDLVVLTVREQGLCALLVKRGISPHRGSWALPGGFVLANEDLLAAAARELGEETGVRRVRAHLEQLQTYGNPRRDPRGRVISIAFLALVADQPLPTAGSDAEDAKWMPISELRSTRRGLAFDHDDILRDGIERARAKLEYTSLGTSFCDLSFTVAELRRVYEAVWDVELDARNFHRKVTSVPGFIAATGKTTTRNGGRPAALYRRGATKLLHPPMLRTHQ